MNPQNANIGLNTPEMIQKELKDLNAELKGKQVDIDFFGTGLPFASIEERSANHLLGNSSWKKICKERFGEEMFNTYAEKFGNKPFDFKLAGFVVDAAQSKYFFKGEKISITSANGKNTGKFPIMEKVDNTITVMLPFTGTDTGSIINLSKLEAAQRKSNLINNRLSQLTGPTPSDPNATILSAPTTGPETQPVPPVDPPPRPDRTDLEKEFDKSQTKNNQIMKTVITVLVIAGLAYGGYKAYQYFNKPAKD